MDKFSHSFIEFNIKEILRSLINDMKISHSKIEIPQEKLLF